MQPYDETEDHFRNVIQKGMKDLASARKSRRCKYFIPKTSSVLDLKTLPS